jgi:transposase InsO family protein
LTPLGRALLVQRVQAEGWRVSEAAAAFGISERTAYKWLARYRSEGATGLADRSSRPHLSPRALSATDRHRLLELRRQRWSLWRVARTVGCSLATAARHAARLGLSRLPPLQPPLPVVRYERACPGELLHIDTKRLGRIDGVGHRITGQREHRARGIGWDAVHLAIDDHSRVSFAGIKADERADSCVQFLRETVTYYAGLGVTIDRVMTDNGSGYVSRDFKAACQALGLRHIRTRPYTPKTNGKVERLVQTSLREWAYVRPYQSSAERAAALPVWLHTYNWHRPHSALQHQPPMSRIPTMNNLLRHNS